ncbi:MAG: hypothetical protein EOM61_06725, partial [Bacteroidia bacterium]|nr:hypothetical protein [Bacteroidia bacterium]
MMLPDNVFTAKTIITQESLTYINKMQALTDYINSLSAKLMMLITGSVILILFLGIFISINLSRTVFLQMGGDPEDVIEIVRTIATGDFTVHIHKDESNTTSLLSYVRDMKESLSSLIAEITQGTE